MYKGFGGQAAALKLDITPRQVTLEDETYMSLAKTSPRLHAMTQSRVLNAPSSSSLDGSGGSSAA